MKILAYIPARAGSKGIANKNIYPLMGKPLISYTIEAAQQSKSIDYIFVSTDCPQTLNLCKKYNINNDYIRPDSLAGDNSLIIDGVIDGLDWLEKRKMFYDVVLLLQPTSPLRTGKNITDAINLFKKSKSNSLVSVNLMREHPYECVKREYDKWEYIEKYHKIMYGRQEYNNNYYYINGAIYLTKIDYIKKYKKFIEDTKATLFEMEYKNSIDIDEYCDIDMAEFFMNKRNLDNG